MFEIIVGIFVILGAVTAILKLMFGASKIQEKVGKVKWKMVFFLFSLFLMLLFSIYQIPEPFRFYNDYLGVVDKKFVADMSYKSALSVVYIIVSLGIIILMFAYYNVFTSTEILKQNIEKLKKEREEINSENRINELLDIQAKQKKEIKEILEKFEELVKNK